MGQRTSALAWGLAALAWLAGLALLQHSGRLPGESALAGLVIATGLLAWRQWHRPHWLGLLLLALVGSMAWGSWRAEQRLAEHLPPAWEGRDVWLQGEVKSLPQSLQGQSGVPGWRFRFGVEQAWDAAGRLLDVIPGELLLSQYAQGGASLTNWRAGQRWKLLVRLRRPHALINPLAGDYELWLLEQGIRATGVLRPAPPQPLAASPWPQIDGLRQDLREAIQKRISGPGDAALLSALSLGDQQAIGRSDWALYRDTGVAHLVAISGMHVTMLAWAAQGLVGRLWRRSARACLRWPAPLAARWAGVAVALAYALFAGWGVPAQRTVWMLASLAALQSAGLRWPWPLQLLAAAWLVTVVDPWAVAQAGFWLSFIAVGLLMAGGSASPQGWRQHLWAGLRAQWIATLGLAPLSLLFFQQLSVVGLVANLLAIPLVSLLITPLALAGSLLPGLWPLAAWCCQGLRAYLQWLQAWSAAVWWLPVAPLWAQALGLVGGGLLVLPLPWRLRLLGLPLALALLWPAASRPLRGSFELLAPDVGQGMAVLIRTERHALLFDSGPQWGPDSDAGQRVLLPLLRGLGEARLDELLLSHRDTDHVGGAASVLAGLPARRLRSSLEDGHPLLQDQAAIRCLAGQRWQWDGVSFEVLHPQAADYRGGAKSNALSCVLRVVDASGRSALLTGDIEAAQEQALLAAGELQPTTVLLAPHHGSKSSSTTAFISAVQPRFVLIQAGDRNRFGHPALEVLARYQAAGAEALASPACGAVLWRSEEVRPHCQRDLARRYWHDAVRLAPLQGEAVGPEAAEAGG
ncbi:DNA internalization-related competence protein ComEC/Rec2 [Pelomonas sp. SE-A7]|uniref:DNA internalization-related competence protein ComEC/Rec2 n=1 Tax=Pelomonas sp. SE-A7 TaxID=3054953 RepID=UPI00259D1B82|nr:DNA internalization-related competence protein ComEC/Rec2 [Pelomonas sp. SE-A7]MDM4765672.1 DNA internalization-related competence protein ComEC/Rec2 [Pelomonas sp. SE-A7]